MATPKLQLLSKTLYDTDGSTTVWDFNFEGGYILQDHIKAYTETPIGLRTPIVVTPAMLIGPWQLQITPALTAGNVLVIYRATPKDAPMVDFVDRGGVSEIALDTVARQAIFVAAEASDDVATSNIDVAVTAANSAEAAKVTAQASASSAAGSASAAATSAGAASTSASNAAASAASLSDLQGSTTVGRAVLKAADAAAARVAIGAQATGNYAATGANNDITSLTALAAGGLPDNSVLTADIANGAVTPSKLSQPLTLGTSVATTSGTAINLAGIPSWATRVTLNWSRVSTNGPSYPLVRLNGQGTDYNAASSVGSTHTAFTNGFGFSASLAGNIISGAMVFTRQGGNTWCCTGIVTFAGVALLLAGDVVLTAPLSSIVLTTLNGTDAYDGGSVSLLFEG